MIKKLLKNEQNLKKYFMEGVIGLKEYYKNYLEKTKMTNLPPQDLYKKIKKLREDIKVDKDERKKVKNENLKKLTEEEKEREKEIKRKINEAYYNQLMKDRKKLLIFENLAEYADYIYKLTLDDSEFVNYSIKNKKHHQERMKAALELLKKSNDVAGKLRKCNL